METLVAKFGGTSLASAAQIRKVTDILRADARRRYAVASAPGKRFSEDIKVTDLLYRCFDCHQEGGAWQEVLAQIKDRFAQIVNELGVSFDLEAEFAAIEAQLQKQPNRDFMASRGEYVNSKILAAYLGWDFVDAAEVVFFTEDGVLDAEKTNEALELALGKCENAVVPGFFGAMPSGSIKTFSRGGSDVTGSLVARAVKAAEYENWTDVSGVLFADPRIVTEPRVIEYISYRELRELSYMGASVLHEDAVFPVRRAGIPINIRNTNRPQDAGTLIVAKLPDGYRMPTVTGVAGRRGFCSIQVEKSMMNGEVGFGARFLDILRDCGVPFEHCPTGIDTMSVIVAHAYFDPKREQILAEIEKRLQPDSLTIEDNMAMIAVVGHGMVASRGCAARVFRTVADAGVNIRMIDQGSSEINIILGVDDQDFEEAIKAIYREFR